MKRADLRRQVKEVVHLSWPEFVQRHPHLAQAIDETMLVEQISESLADDPAFKSAIARAQIVGQTAQTITHWAQRAINAMLALRLSPD